MNKNLRKRKIKALVKIANDKSNEDLIFAMRSVSKETGTPMIVLKELYEDYPEEMKKILFPETPEYQKITGIANGMKRSTETALDVKTVGGVHILLNMSKKDIKKDISLGGWPFIRELSEINKQVELSDEDLREEGEIFANKYRYVKKYFQGYDAGNSFPGKYISKLKNYEKAWDPNLKPGFDIVNKTPPGNSIIFGNPHFASLGCCYLVPIGCSYYFIPIITKTEKPIVVKIPGGPSENTFIPGTENSTGIGYNLIVGSRNNLNPYFKNMIKGIYGCDIGKKKKINKKEEIEKLKERILTAYDEEPRPENDPRFDENPHGDQGFGKIEYFAYKGMSPVNYKSFSYNPEAHSAIIHRSILQKIKQRNPALHSKLMSQKISNQNKNSSTSNYLTKKEIDDIIAEYSGGGLLESPNIKLEYDVGDEITPDGKHIEKSLHPNLEPRYK